MDFGAFADLDSATTERAVRAFVVSCKLLGLFLLYVGLTYALTALLLRREGASVILLQLSSAAVAFAFGFVLLFRTELVTRVARIPDGEAAPAAGWDAREILRTGVVLIGLYVFVTRLGGALQEVGLWLDGGPLGRSGRTPILMLVEAVPLLLAALFVLRADLVVSFVERQRVGPRIGASTGGSA